MTPYLLAIDNGSQSTKVTIFDPLGHPLASARRPLRPYDTSVPGHAVHPGDDIWDSIWEACRDAMAQFDGDPADIAAVGLCTIRFCRALLTADGRLAEPVMSWMDERVSRRYEPASPLTRYITTSSGYITHRMTGQFVDAAANYQGVWPIDQDTATWSGDPAAYAATGMPRDMLFDLVPPGGLLGEVTRAAAEATGIPAGLPVYATANDKAVEALGSGLDDDGTVLLSLGTYIAAMTVGSSCRSADDTYWANFAAQPGKYLYESTGIRRGMWTVSWYRTVLEGSPGQEPGTQDLQDALNAAASELAPGCNGLLTVPDWLAPGHATWRRGALLGFDGSQGRAHIYRSILEGIALTMANNTAAMERALGRRSPSILVSGGGSSSGLMMQIVADVFERPARRTAFNDAAGVGAAICAAVGHGIYPDFAKAAAAMVAFGDTFVPDERAVTAYRKVNQVYAGLTAYTGPLFRFMAEGLAGLDRA
ncbi:MAG TPA: FGGY-family carbohydrate kinase [Streptosporangiaceae bacterium]|nr:FGGY-family carbohydrate kinase [Streptosporangiaceae bacterium]